MMTYSLTQSNPDGTAIKRSPVSHGARQRDLLERGFYDGNAVKIPSVGFGTADYDGETRPISVSIPGHELNCSMIEDRAKLESAVSAKFGGAMLLLLVRGTDKFALLSSIEELSEQGFRKFTAFVDRSIVKLDPVIASIVSHTLVASEGLVMVTQDGKTFPAYARENRDWKNDTKTFHHVLKSRAFQTVGIPGAGKGRPQKEFKNTYRLLYSTLAIDAEGRKKVVARDIGLSFLDLAPPVLDEEKARRMLEAMIFVECFYPDSMEKIAEDKINFVLHNYVLPSKRIEGDMWWSGSSLLKNQVSMDLDKWLSRRFNSF